MRLKIDPQSLTTGAIVGKAILTGVKSYHNSNSFLRDRNKHIAGTEYSGHKYGFLIENASKFKKPIVIQGKLGFFNLEFD